MKNHYQTTIENIKNAVLPGANNFNGTPLSKVQTAGTYTQKMAHATKIAIRTFAKIQAS